MTRMKHLANGNPSSNGCFGGRAPWHNASPKIRPQLRYAMQRAAMSGMRSTAMSCGTGTRDPTGVNCHKLSTFAHARPNSLKNSRRNPPASSAASPAKRISRGRWSSSTEALPICETAERKRSDLSTSRMKRASGSSLSCISSGSCSRSSPNNPCLVCRFLGSVCAAAFAHRAIRSPWVTGSPAGQITSKQRLAACSSAKLTSATRSRIMVVARSNMKSRLSSRAKGRKAGQLSTVSI
mmetsp:Transcript_54509/g.137602  ORF Transcript_54509/g.137602 Transcript_54509/m.137602 type:complete len:238 (-) Transcript_54509:597-1310(-)